MWPDFKGRGSKKPSEVETEFLVHLEAVAAFWKARELGTTGESISCTQSHVISELWTVPNAQLGLLIPKCESLAPKRPVNGMKLHVVMEYGGVKWWFTRPSLAADGVVSYAALTKHGLLTRLRSESVSLKNPEIASANMVHLCRSGKRSIENIIGAGSEG